jgi:hypothetical protein
MHFLITAMLRLVASVVSRGGEPRQETRDGRFGLTYPLRPGPFAFAVAALGCGVYLMVWPVRVVERVESLLLGMFLVAVASFLLTRTLRLDEEGLSLRSVFAGTRRIKWSAFSHVERYQSTSAGKATWFIRSVPGCGWAGYDDHAAGDDVQHGGSAGEDSCKGAVAGVAKKEAALVGWVSGVERLE